MSAMAMSRTVPPAMWWQVGGIWVYVVPLDDPLLRAELHRVTVDWSENYIRVHVAGNSAGCEWSTTEPDMNDGGPL